MSNFGSMYGSVEIGKSEIVNAINTLGISGSEVCIHSSMRSFGAPLKHGLNGIVDAFRERRCTIMVPTFSDIYEVRPIKKFMPEHNGAGDYSFFLEQSYAEIEPFTTDSKEPLPSRSQCSSATLITRRPAAAISPTEHGRRP